MIIACSAVKFPALKLQANKHSKYVCLYIFVFLREYEGKTRRSKFKATCCGEVQTELPHKHNKAKNNNKPSLGWSLEAPMKAQCAVCRPRYQAMSKRK